jgi:hypothetical protein
MTKKKRSLRQTPSGPTYGHDIMVVGEHKGKCLRDIPVNYWRKVLRGDIAPHHPSLRVYARRRITNTLSKAKQIKPKAPTPALKGLLNRMQAKRKARWTKQ